MEILVFSIQIGFDKGSHNSKEENSQIIKCDKGPFFTSKLLPNFNKHFMFLKLNSFRAVLTCKEPSFLEKIFKNDVIHGFIILIILINLHILPKSN